MTAARALVALRACLMVLWFAAVTVQAAQLSGRVVGVIDGDTVDVLTDSKQLIRVRLAGIDAPERGQPFGAVAKRVLSDLVFSKPAVLEGEKIDRFGRLVAKVVVGGQDANLRLVRLGYAWHFKRYELEQTPADRRLYDFAQGAAMQERAGLWKDPAPIAPWDFRASRRNTRSRKLGVEH